MNELILLGTVVLIYGTVLLGYMLFGRAGLYCVGAVATVFANIEVGILINAFGLEQTLGNVLFAATFLATDILSECESKRSANKAVAIGVFVTLFFLALCGSWALFAPSENDVVMPAVRVVFSQTPRIVCASLTVFVVSQFFDVWLYHKWWELTAEKFGDRKRFLWLRNNGSTLVSQLINSLLFTLLAFGGVYDFATLMSVFGSGYIIFIFTSLLDTPVVYIARRFHASKEKSKLLPALDNADKK